MLSKVAGLTLLLCCAIAPAGAAESESEADKEFVRKLNALHWVEGPKTVETVGDATLDLPADYVFLDPQETAKFEELTENPSDGTSTLFAPARLSWSGYLSFDDVGYVKDDEELDADALLQDIRNGTEEANKERRKRGWAV